MDGSLLGTNSAATAPITNLTNARIGSQQDYSVVRLRLASIFGAAGTDDAIHDESVRIRSELGL